MCSFANWFQWCHLYARPSNSEVAHWLWRSSHFHGYISCFWYTFQKNFHRCWSHNIFHSSSYEKNSVDYFSSPECDQMPFFGGKIAHFSNSMGGLSVGWACMKMVPLKSARKTAHATMFVQKYFGNCYSPPSNQVTSVFMFCKKMMKVPTYVLSYNDYSSLLPNLQHNHSPYS